MSTPVDRTCTKLERESLELVPSDSMPLDHYRAAAAYVLLGDPGSGKTTAFRSECGKLGENAAFIRARDFLAHGSPPADWWGKTIFIDGLDEVRAGALDARTPFDAIWSRLLEMGRPRFRISCRAADWFGANDRERLESVSGDSRLTVLQLDPLTLEDARLILTELGLEDLEALMNRAGAMGLGGLLQNPQCLKLLVKATERGQDWPSSRSEVFEMACKAIVAERNPEHRIVRRSSAPIGIEPLIDSAGHLCAIQLISDSPGYPLADDPGDDDGASLEKLEYCRPDALRRAVASKLFTLTGDCLLSPVHREIAEFLGGRHLARLVKEGVPAGRVLALMKGGDGAVVTALRGLSGWLAAYSAEARADLISIDPVGVGLYGDADVFSTDDKRKLLALLLRDPSRLAEAWGGSAAFATLAEADDDIRLILDTAERDDHAEVRVGFVLQILSHRKGAPSHLSRMLAIVRDDRWSSQLRELALKAFIRVQHDLPERPEPLKELLAAVFTGQVSDPFRELCGMLLEHLYPHAVRPRTVWGYLSEQVETNHFGSYLKFWVRGLAEQSSDDDVAELLDGLAARSSELDPAIERLRLWGKVIDLLQRGIHAHGQAIETARLYRWLDVGSRGLFRLEANPPEAVGWIRKWLEGRSDAKRALVETELSELERADGIPPEGLRFSDLLFGAALPDDFGLQCIKRSVNLAPTNEQAAIQLFRRGYRAFKDGEFARGLSSEVLQEYALRSSILEELLKSLEAPGVASLDDARWKRRQEAFLEPEQAQTSELLERVRSNQAALSENRCTPRLLFQLALVYFGEAPEIDGSYRERDALVLALGEGCLVDAAMDGLRRCVDRDDLPTSQEIARLRREPQEHLLGLPLMACLEECERQSPGFMRLLDESKIRTCIACYHRGAPAWWRVKGSFPEWYQWLLGEMPEVVSQVAVQCAKAALRSGQHLDPTFWSLVRDRAHEAAARDAALAVLEAVPARCNQRLLDELDGLLWAVIRFGAKAELRELVKRRLTLESVMRGQRVHWLAAGLILSSSEFGEQLFQAVRGKERLVSHLEAFYTASGSGGGAIYDDLDSRGLEILIGLLGGSRIPVSFRESGFLLGAIRSLGSRPDQFANDALRSLLKCPKLEAWRPQLENAERNQRIVRRDSEYRHPTLAEVSDTLSRGKPANSADLAALAIHHIRQIAERVRTSNVDEWRQYWNFCIGGRKACRPKVENHCRDALLSDLRLSLPNSVDAEPEAAHANSTRADIELRSGRHRVPIEVKKNDAVDLWTAARDQLINKYTLEPATGGYGIYLVFWFGSDKQRSRSDRVSPRSPRVSPRSPKELEDRLKESLGDVERRKIEVCVVDVSLPPAVARCTAADCVIALGSSRCPSSRSGRKEGTRRRGGHASVAEFDLFVQEGCILDEQRPAIEAAIAEACSKVLGIPTDSVRVRWTVIREGFGFRGGKPSTTSLVRGRIPDGCDAGTRGELLRSIGEEWCTLVGADSEEVVVSARDWSWTG